MRVQRRHRMIVVALMVMALIFTSMPLTSATYAASYSPAKAAAYAQKWAYSYNDKQYKRIDNDCTNFVSQCIAAGGKGFVNPTSLNISVSDWYKGYKYTGDSNRWYNKKYNYRYLGMTKGVFCYSSNFTFVNNFYNFWSRQRCCSTYGCYNSSARNSALQKLLKKGDIVQLYDQGSGWHHTIIITSGKKGDWNYCAHTNAAKDKPLKSINQKGRYYRVIRINY